MINYNIIRITMIEKMCIIILPAFSVVLLIVLMMDGVYIDDDDDDGWIKKGMYY